MTSLSKALTGSTMELYTPENTGGLSQAECDKSNSSRMLLIGLTSVFSETCFKPDGKMPRLTWKSMEEAKLVADGRNTPNPGMLKDPFIAYECDSCRMFHIKMPLDEAAQVKHYAERAEKSKSLAPTGRP